MITNIDIRALTSAQYAAIVDDAKRDAAQLRHDAMAGLAAGLGRRLRTAWARLGTPTRSPSRRARRDPRQLEIGVLCQPPASCVQ